MEYTPSNVTNVCGQDACEHVFIQDNFMYMYAPILITIPLPMVYWRVAIITLTAWSICPAFKYIRISSWCGCIPQNANYLSGTHPAMGAMPNLVSFMVGHNELYGELVLYLWLCSWIKCESACYVCLLCFFMRKAGQRYSCCLFEICIEQPAVSCWHQLVAVCHFLISR